jgi:DNA-binding protein H-NS
MQVVEADRLRRQIEAERTANAEINKSEMRQRLRELRTWRKLANLSEAAPAPAPKVEVPAPPAAKPRAQTSPSTREPVKVKPVILAKPPGAPVKISPPPNFSPSQ